MSDRFTPQNTAEEAKEEEEPERADHRVSGRTRSLSVEGVSNSVTASPDEDVTGAVWSPEEVSVTTDPDVDVVEDGTVFADALDDVVLSTVELVVVVVAAVVVVGGTVVVVVVVWAELDDVGWVVEVGLYRVVVLVA
jgi:hypothetical protein